MTTRGKTVAIVTLGCAKNQADTDNLARLLEAQGHRVVDDPAGADAIVVHTCSFIQAAKQESIEAILEAGRLKGKGRPLIVSGCLVQQHGPDLLKDLPEVDAFLGTGQLGQIPALLEKPRARFLDRARPGGYMDPDVPSPRKTPGVTATLRLSEGCRHPCAFCVIPRLRGPVQRRPAEAILKEARALAGSGVEEFVVIAQDTGDWGPGLPGLLHSVAALPGVRWIRLMYMHPASFTDELLDLFAGQPDRFPYLDIPLQHIDSRVLAEMKRRSDEAGLRALVERLRRRAPDLSLRTTFIVGFPGETDAQFERLLGFVKEGHFDYLGAFAYSQEEGTPAGRRTDQVPEDVRQARVTALTETWYGIAEARARRRLGTIETVLLEEPDDGGLLGRTRREAPEIDAVVRLPRGTGRRRAGRFIEAKLTGYDAYEFTAEPVRA